MTKNNRQSNLGMGVYLPEKVLDNDELERRQITLPSGKKLLAKQILDKIGVERRHIAGDKQTVADMGYEAAKTSLRGSGRVDLILTSSSHPTLFHVAEEIKKRLGLRVQTNEIAASAAQGGLLAMTEVLDIHAACSGSALLFSYLLEKQNELQGKKVLLVATEKFSDSIVDLRHRDAMKLDSSLGQTIFGDGAAAVCFTAGQDMVIHYALNKVLPDLSGKKDLILMAMGENKFVEPCVVRPVATSEKLKDFPKGYFTQNGPRVFEDVQNIIPGLIREAVDKAGFKPTDIDLVVIHSGSKRVVDALRLKLSPDFEVYSDYKDGNMSSVSLLYSFIKAVQEGRIGSGSKVVLCGFGAGSPDLYSSTVVVELK
ncbi:hypothetical protein KJ980_04905 [Patescibacteria group bacterium]|nr:hypothetical protein [Patescibacteria group bacterium]MBU4098958.1 hypothetical protein [Patescibacteria group bacterium]